MRGGLRHADQVACSPDAAPPSLSLVIPAYNEAARITDTIANVLAFLRDQPYRTELILVDDGSTDGTATLARQPSPALRMLAS
jgi:cellulose synthase/poly-beta-1,6-N-acetylglucosamine synthase-like glycosyltransferase